jgi:hypothetical protein
LIRRILQEEQIFKEKTTSKAKDTSSALMVRKGKFKFKEKRFKCSKDGHMKANCKVKKNKGEDKGFKGKCCKCGKKGHMALDCNRKKNAKEDKKSYKSKSNKSNQED